MYIYSIYHVYLQGSLQLITPKQLHSLQLFSFRLFLSSFCLTLSRSVEGAENGWEIRRELIRGIAFAIVAVVVVVSSIVLEVIQQLGTC